MISALIYRLFRVHVLWHNSEKLQEKIFLVVLLLQYTYFIFSNLDPNAQSEKP